MTFLPHDMSKSFPVQAPMHTASEIALGKSGQKNGKFSPKFGKLSKDCATRAVAYLVELYPAKTAEYVAADTGLAPDTVRKWLMRVSSPSFMACMTLIAAYGPEFLAAVMDKPPVWIDTAARAARREQLAREMAALEAEMAGAALGGEP